jgi:hypothetical protein
MQPSSCARASCPRNRRLPHDLVTRVPVPNNGSICPDEQPIDHMSSCHLGRLAGIPVLQPYVKRSASRLHPDGREHAHQLWASASVGMDWPSAHEGTANNLTSDGLGTRFPSSLSTRGWCSPMGAAEPGWHEARVPVPPRCPRSRRDSRPAHFGGARLCPLSI